MGVTVCVERRPNMLEVDAVFAWPSTTPGRRAVSWMLEQVRGNAVDTIEGETP